MFIYYEDGRADKITMRKVYRMYCIMVDAEQKAQGTNFISWLYEMERMQILNRVDCQHFFRQIFLGYFSDIVQAFDTLRTNVCGDDYTSLHNPIVLSSVLPAYGMFHSIQILFL